MPSFARVSVNIPQLTGLFDYHIPPEYAGMIQPGSLVNIPFGRQSAQGVVVSLVDQPAVEETKDITTLVDAEPVLTAYQLRLAQRMAQDNLATLSQCIDLMVPPGLSQQADMLIQREPGGAPADLTPLVKRLLNLL
jgi:primosomal protein N' (replication factor Y)